MDTDEHGRGARVGQTYVMAVLVAMLAVALAARVVAFRFGDMWFSLLPLAWWLLAPIAGLVLVRGAVVLVGSIGTGWGWRILHLAGVLVGVVYLWTVVMQPLGRLLVRW